MEEEQARLAKEQEYQDGQIHRVSANSWYYIDKYYTKKEINSIILTECPDARQRKSELQQTFKQAGAAMKDAFSTLFNVKRKEKEPTQTPTESSLKTETTSSNEDNW